MKIFLFNKHSVIIVLCLNLLLSACGGGSDSDKKKSVSDENVTVNNPLDPNVVPVIVGSWYRPVVFATWQWQLQGTLNTSYVVDIYDVDLFDTPESTLQQLQAMGAYVICYFSGGSYEKWRDDAPAFSPSVLGKTLDGWQGERWLDIRVSNVHDIMLDRLDLAQQKGCDGVEVDNVDAYTNKSGFPLTSVDQLAYNRFIANAAHERGLAVALKNDLDQIDDLVEYFDLAVNEQCFEYKECDLLAPFTDAGKPVLQVEYKSSYVSDSMKRQQLCQDAQLHQFSTLVLPLDLDDSYRFACP